MILLPAWYSILSKSAGNGLQRGHCMYHINIIQQSLDYIEDNLKTEVSILELAEMAGYSLYHFERIFKKLVGISISQYIKRRRLLHAAFEIANGRKIIDAAFDYGFDTNAGFYKAFVREFGSAPSEYVSEHTVKCPYRIKLIQEEHILITHEKIKSILTHWNLENESVSDFHDTNSGQRIDNTWQIGSHYVMQVGTNVIGLRNHIAVSRILKERCFVVSLPVQTISGEDYAEEGGLYYFLAQRVSGKPMNDHLLFADGGVELAYKLGQAIGRLNAALAEFDFVCNEPDLLEQMEKHCIPKLKAACSFEESFYRDFSDHMSKLYPLLPKQLIHRDPNPSNIISENGEITGFLDFELTERNVRIFDPCYAATAVLSETYADTTLNRDKWFDILQGIITGYDDVVKLTDAEKAAIPYVIYSIQMTCISFFSDFERYKALAETNTEMLKWLIQHSDNLSRI